MTAQFKFGAYEAVARTRHVVPSKLYVFELCPLRYVLETERQGPAAIAPGPMALRGTAIHAVIQHFSGDPVPAAIELLEAFSASFASQARSHGANALVRLAFASAGLKGLLNSEQILGACRFIREILIKAPQAMRLSNTTPTFAVGAASTGIVGTERKLSSTVLDMEGRPDLIYENGAVVNVVDYKSGNIREANGEIKRAYAIQAAAYGALVKELAGPTEIRLTIEGAATTWSENFNAAHARLVHELLAGIQLRLPKDKPLAPAALARAGPHCVSCASRLFCHAYVAAPAVAAASWQRHDVCGTVSDVSWKGELGSLRIRRADGTMASIVGIPAVVCAEPARGDTIRAWSLGAMDLPGRAAFASNFYLFRSDSPRNSSFEGAIHLE